MTFLSQLSWRYATKNFDSSKKVSDEDLEKILEAIRMTPTSFGLQPYHFFIITNQELKNKIQTVSWNQAQLGTCSHLIVLCSRSDLDTLKNEYFDGLSGGSTEVRASMSGYESMIAGFIPNASPEWTKKQTYIAQGFALAACAELGIDSCPMEGFDGKALSEILALPETLSPAVMLPIGYRAESEVIQAKFRFSREKLFSFMR